MDLKKLKLDAATHLGVTGVHFGQRFDRLVGNLASKIEQTLECDAEAAAKSAIEQIGSLSLREVCMLCAEGPVEQTRALLSPEEVNPPQAAEAAERMKAEG